MHHRRGSCSLAGRTQVSVPVRSSRPEPFVSATGLPCDRLDAVGIDVTLSIVVGGSYQQQARCGREGPDRSLRRGRLAAGSAAVITESGKGRNLEREAINLAAYTKSAYDRRSQDLRRGSRAASACSPARS